MYKPTQEEYGPDDSFRRKFGFIILFLVVLIVVVLLVSSFILIMGFNPKQDQREITYYVFGAVLPLIGTWFGILLAFFFSGENFKSANRALYNMVDRILLIGKNLSTPAIAKMVTLENMPKLQITSDKPVEAIKIKSDLIDVFELENSTRLPILDHEYKPIYVIHRSLLDKYLLEKVLQENMNLEIFYDLSLEKLFKENEQLRRIFTRNFDAIKSDATFAEARTKLEKGGNCSDIFVTKNGMKNEPVLGWLTDTDIWKSL